MRILFLEARVEKIRASLGATWVYTETFSETRLIDMQNSTAWIDTSEGISFIPNSGDEKTIPMHSISLIESSLPRLGDFLGSNPKQAFDGIDSTNWRCLFVNDQWATATYDIATLADITAISIDPVGFGIEAKIDVEIEGSYQELIRAVIYNKKTFSIYQHNVSKIRVSFRSATSVLPKIVGIREIILFQTISTKSAEIISRELKPTDPFTEIKLSTKGEFPQGTKVDTYFRTSTGTNWIPLPVNDWHPIYATDTTSIHDLNFTEAVAGISSLSFRGLYAKNLNMSSTPLTNVEGKMEVGENMVEITCFKKDWIEAGEFPKILSPLDFANYKVKRTWSKVPIRSYITNGSGNVVQLYGETTIKTDTELTKEGTAMLFQRRLDPDRYPAEISQFNQLCVIPLVGAKASGSMQFDYNYKISFMVFAPRAFSYQDARYWFYQGYRKANRRLYRDIGKSFGTFVLYVNDILVVGEDTAKTISTDHKIEGISVSQVDRGKSFSLNLNTGWNKIEILMNVYDTDKYRI